jgi:hypothetical protein
MTNTSNKNSPHPAISPDARISARARLSAWRTNSRDRKAPTAWPRLIRHGFGRDSPPLRLEIAGNRRGRHDPTEVFHREVEDGLQPGDVADARALHHVAACSSIMMDACRRPPQSSITLEARPPRRAAARRPRPGRDTTPPKPAHPSKTADNVLRHASGRGCADPMRGPQAQPSS